MTFSNWTKVAAIGCLVAGSALAQHVISARSGLIHYTEGQVVLGEASINPKVGEYPEIKEGQHLTTKAGRAEVLLTPGVFLRVAEDSDIIMLANRLTDTRVEIVAGSVILEAGEVIKDGSIQLLVAGTPIEVRKAGLYKVDVGSRALVRVYDGELAVIGKSGPVTLKEGRQVFLANIASVEKFAKDDTDSFLRWASRRSGYLASANQVSANYMRERQIPWNGSGWYFNQMLGMYTFIPFDGQYRNYWDYAYYSPRQIPPPMMPGQGMSAGNSGFSAMSSTVRGMQDSSGRSYAGGGSGASAGYSSGGGAYQAPATASAPSPASSGGSRSGDSGGGGGSRGGSGGGR